MGEFFFSKEATLLAIAAVVYWPDCVRTTLFFRSTAGLPHHLFRVCSTVMASSFALAKLFGEKERERVKANYASSDFLSSGEGSNTTTLPSSKRERVFGFFHFNLPSSLMTIIFGWFSGQEKVNESVF